MVKIYFPFEFNINIWKELDDEACVEMSEEDARRLQYRCENTLGFSFEDVSAIEDDYFPTKDIYEAAYRAAKDRLTERITEDPSIIDEYLQDHDLKKPGEPVTKEHIAYYLEEMVNIVVKYPEYWNFNQLKDR